MDPRSAGIVVVKYTQTTKKKKSIKATKKLNNNLYNGTQWYGKYKDDNVDW